MAEHRINKVHFIGIGGVGMSGIARVAKEKGMEVSGSDLRESRYTQQLREAGVKIFIGQSASNLEGLDPDVVVVPLLFLKTTLSSSKQRNATCPSGIVPRCWLRWVSAMIRWLLLARMAKPPLLLCWLPLLMPWASIPRSLSAVSFALTVRMLIAEKANTMW